MIAENSENEVLSESEEEEVRLWEQSKANAGLYAHPHVRAGQAREVASLVRLRASL